MRVIVWSLATSKYFTLKRMARVKYRLCKSKHHVTTKVHYTAPHMINILKRMQN